MKKFFLVAATLMLGVSVAFAADFAPMVMTLDAPPAIQYDFDGSALEFTVNLAGAPQANSVFAVYTRGMGETIGTVQNGFLGWHYVNQIDTCLYFSIPTVLDQGANTVTWDGNDNEGNAVPAGDYTYYLWAYDHVSNKTLAAPVNLGWNPTETVFTYNEDGVLYDKPLIIDGGHGTSGDDIVDRVHTKWLLGDDPEVTDLIERCTVQTYGADLGNITLDPENHMMWFKQAQNPNGTVEVYKFSWEPNDYGVLQTDWAEDGVASFAQPDNQKSTEYHNALATVEGGTDIFALSQDYIRGATDINLVYIDIASGEIMNEVDITEWWVNVDDGDKGGQAGGGPSDLYDGFNGTLLFNCHGSCVTHLIDPYRFGSDDINELTLWVNENGDIVGDRHTDGGDMAWVCNDYMVAPYRYNAVRDRTGFYLSCGSGIGNVSIELFGPDGTGIGQFSFAGDTTTLNKGQYVVSEGTPYDGIYVDGAKQGLPQQFLFLGYDSISGILSHINTVDEAVADFAVEAAYPNPFNPTTTITYTAPAGHVNVDVYNVAGQKVDTLVNEVMSAGTHSVVWDASGFSAGMYFYTVKAGEFSETMKMTLVK